MAKSTKTKTSRIDLHTQLNPHQNFFFNNTKITREFVLNPDNIFEKPIYDDCNIGSMHTIDFEYQEYGSLISSLNKLKLDNDNDVNFKNEGVFINTFKEYQKAYKELNIDILDIIKNPKNIKIYNSLPDNIDDNLVMGEPILLTGQIKNSLDLKEQGTIFISNHANDMRNTYIERNKELQRKYDNYQYPIMEDDCLLLDYMRLKGYDINIKRFEDKEEFKSESSHLKTYTMNLVAFFALVDIPFLFRGEYLQDIMYFIQSGSLEHEKRMKVKDDKHFKNSFRPWWIIEINGLEYKVAINIIDAMAMHGNVGLNNFLINSGIELEHKKALDEYKPRMFEALIEVPEIYHNYSLGDLKVYDGILKYADTWLNSIHKDLNILDRYQAPRFTLGSSCNNLVFQKLLKLFNYSNSIEDKEEFIELFCKSASPKYLKEYNSRDENTKNRYDVKTKTYNRFLASNCFGGRCYNDAMKPYIITTAPFLNTLCDIDMESAYTSAMSNKFLMLGTPAIRTYTSKEEMTLREFIKRYKYEIGIDNFNLRVYGILKYEQDVIASWINSKKTLKNKLLKDEKEQHYWSYKANLKEAKTIILTKEVQDGVITSDLLDLIQNEFSPCQRDDFLDNLKVKVCIIFPKSMECKSIEELKLKIKEHENGAKHNFKLDIEYADNERGNRCNYYYKVDFGEFIIDVIRTYRNIYKHKKIKSLDELLKVVGNAIYGVSVSDLFPNSNIVFGNNITASIRVVMWCLEKALGGGQSITDGCTFDMNNVRYKIQKQVDTTQFTRAYKKTNRELTNNNKWSTKPLTKNKIRYEERMIDGISQPTWIIDDKPYNFEETKKIINKLALEHTQAMFPNVRLLNDNFRHLKKDDKGAIIHDENNKPFYVYEKGCLKLEVKTFIKEIHFSNLSDYMYKNYLDELVIKTRSHETKKDANGHLLKEHVAIFLDENKKLVLCAETYKKIATTEKFFNDKYLNEEAVPLSHPVIITQILKTKDFNIGYNKTYQYTILRPGCIICKLVIRPLFSMSGFKWLSAEQYRFWYKIFLRLKNKYGISFELFFMNHDGTCNMEKMRETLEYMVYHGITNPLKGGKSIIDGTKIKGLDPHNNLNRDMLQSTKDYIFMLDQARLLCRGLLVGFRQVIKEKCKIKESVNHENDLDFDTLHKYSTQDEFSQNEEIWDNYG